MFNAPDAQTSNQQVELVFALIEFGFNIKDYQPQKDIGAYE